MGAAAAGFGVGTGLTGAGFFFRGGFGPMGAAAAGFGVGTGLTGAGFWAPAALAASLPKISLANSSMVSIFTSFLTVLAAASLAFVLVRAEMSSLATLFLAGLEARVLGGAERATRSMAKVLEEVVMEVWVMGRVV